MVLMPLAEGATRRASKTIASGEFRRARKTVRDHLREGKKLSSAELHQHVTAAKAIRDAWAEVGDPPGVPRVPGELAAAAAQFEQLRTEGDELGGWLDRTNLLDQSAEDLGSLLTALLGDQGTLTTLPDLYQLRSALSERHLVDLLSELDDRQVGVDLALQVFEYVWLTSILEAVALTDSRVGAFNGAEHRRSVEEFRTGDAEHIETTAERVRRLCAEEATHERDAPVTQTLKFYLKPGARQSLYLGLRFT